MTSLKIGILIVCDDTRKLLGVISDGDMRRAFLETGNLNVLCGAIMNASPVVAHEGVTEEQARQLLEESKAVKLDYLPVLDRNGCIIDLILRHELREPVSRPVTALIMAGGFGTRLGPLTKRTPKPMLKIAGQPLLEHTLNHLQRHGIERAYISTHFLRDRIKRHIGDGAKYGMEINYLDEAAPLGTAGAIGLLPAFSNTLLLMNGDILTNVDIQAMVEFHRNSNNDMTVAVKKYAVEFPYGVVECEGYRVKSLVEKPTSTVFVNAGIYLIEPAVKHFVKSGVHLDMNRLICSLIESGRELSAFPIIEYWLDVGSPPDYEEAKNYEPLKQVA